MKYLFTVAMATMILTAQADMELVPEKDLTDDDIGAEVVWEEVSPMPLIPEDETNYPADDGGNGCEVEDVED